MPHNPLTALLADQRCIVLDGALATELEARGCNLGDALWSAKVLLEQPQLIRQVHLDYFQAGAQCAITASYQATPLGFAARGLDLAQSQQLIARSAQLALEARDAYRAMHADAGALLVAGSVGPYGAYLADGSEYRGDYALPQAQMLDFHRPRIAALVAAGVDLLACETQPSAAEIVALLALLQEFPQSTAWFSFTLRDAMHLSDGTALREVVALLDGHPQVVALGINCIAPELGSAALQHLATLTRLPLVVYPNSGEHYDAAGKRWDGAGSDACGLLDRVDAWRAAGARLIGGCCRTTPRAIAQLAQRLRTNALHGG
ncbi:homocysteine S-methyltransferase [Xanthomonas translucens pv. translucens]|uniref:S-methylmethionine:homocysteine methyltransferase n=3 Tax=Xanthomonas campestris pv. translucens TaxID=343 RepID=A0A109HM35_XANCT|nr:homocysteine S-methyltransferase [Xanthomonas translucens]KWV14783.1 homocysteine methyltransferase [Xanthomonas translucens]KWV16317.1 homocysteine methyltransferase [Xanthomonas translucens]MCS3359070.1 homocysteine S-methyltransferase [Xanthomonas translucens pv. translucens]MCS3372379.1 homocysteine S-methyltransferase [Xanthomonas translucens pv. translucens]MCT8288590.1 homocysteine S-methyltransferase [Xanthomonas translucens pv. translucens]